MIYSVLVGVDYCGVVLCFGGARERLTWECRDSVPRYRRIGIIHIGCGCLMIERDRILCTWVRSVCWTWICLCHQTSSDCGLLTTSYPLCGCCQALIRVSYDCCCRNLRLAQMGFTMSLSKTCPCLLCGARAM